jgi:hypothetical protein
MKQVQDITPLISGIAFWEGGVYLLFKGAGENEKIYDCFGFIVLV